MSDRNHFFDEKTIDSDKWVNVPNFKFGFNARHIIIVNDSRENTVEFSFNGHDLDGKLYPRDKSISLDLENQDEVYIRIPEKRSTQVRVWAWVGI